MCDQINLTDFTLGLWALQWKRLFLTDGLGVELWVQWLQWLQCCEQLFLWTAAGCAVSGAHWTLDHFLFFFVLHRCIDVEAWDLPWGKIYNETRAKHAARQQGCLCVPFINRDLQEWENKEVICRGIHIG